MSASAEESVELAALDRDDANDAREAEQEREQWYRPLAVLEDDGRAERRPPAVR